MIKIAKLTMAVLFATGYISTAQAAVTGQVDVKLKVSTGCKVGGSAVEGSMNKFGTLDFGRTSGTWTNVLTGQVASSGTGGDLEVTCDGKDAVAFTVAIDGGLSGNRNLKNTSGADTVAYNVYRDAARSVAYEIGKKQDFSAASGKAQNIPIFGAIPANSTAKAQGDYTDTLLVTVNF